MTKTELQKQRVKAAIELLEKYGAEFNGDDEGGRLGFTIMDLPGQFSRRDMEVALWDSIKLHGDGFTKDQIDKHNQAVVVEAALNEALAGLE